MGGTAGDDPIPVSALQHWSYCPRQCGLIHVERTFAESVHTLRGRALHATVDIPGSKIRAGCRVERALPLYHDRLGLIGKADVVEFDPAGQAYPIEYKAGSRHKRSDIAACDDLQLAAQAVCLEWMIGRAVAEGALYYARSRRRRPVAITDALRAAVEQAAASVRRMMAAGLVPAPTEDVSRCEACSLRTHCQPEATRTLRSGGGEFGRLFDPDST